MYDDRFMVECSTCFDWFHAECVGMCVEEVNKLSEFQCPSCGTSMRAEVVPVRNLHAVLPFAGKQRPERGLITKNKAKETVSFPGRPPRVHLLVTSKMPTDLTEEVESSKSASAGCTHVVIF